MRFRKRRKHPTLGDVADRLFSIEAELIIIRLKIHKYLKKNQNYHRIKEEDVNGLL